jgi:hypothetical protein
MNIPSIRSVSGDVVRQFQPFFQRYSHPIGLFDRLSCHHELANNDGVL